MIIKILGDCESAAFKAVKAFVKSKGHTFWCEGYRCDLAIAPLLTVKVPDEELKEANWGTLIFHPSPLPYGRGASSIKCGGNQFPPPHGFGQTPAMIPAIFASRK